MNKKIHVKEASKNCNKRVNLWLLPIQKKRTE